MWRRYVCFFRYCVGGYVYNGRVLGKEGQNRIPQVEFWQDLPALVVDGIRYSAFLVQLAVAKYTGSDVPERPQTSEGRAGPTTAQLPDNDDMDRAPLISA